MKVNKEVINIKNLHVYNAPVTQGRIQRGGQGRKAKSKYI